HRADPPPRRRRPRRLEGHRVPRGRGGGALPAGLRGQPRHHDLGGDAGGRTHRRTREGGGTMTSVYVQDVTLRDGMHAIRHQISPATVGRIVRALDQAGVPAIEVTHGDGLAGSRLNYGPGSNTDWEWIEAAVANAENA